MTASTSLGADGGMPHVDGVQPNSSIPLVSACAAHLTPKTVADHVMPEGFDILRRDHHRVDVFRAPFRAAFGPRGTDRGSTHHTCQPLRSTTPTRRLGKVCHASGRSGLVFPNQSQT